MTFSTGEGMWKAISGVDQKLADEILKRSFDADVNFVDTADVYTNGESSNWYGWQLMKALDISEAKNLAKLDTLQAYYSIAGRDLERENQDVGG